MTAHAIPRRPAGAAMSQPVDIERDDGIMCRTEPEKLPNSGTRPDRSGFFAPVIQARPTRAHLRREGREIFRKENTRRGLLAVLSLPAPIISMGVNSEKPTGGHHGR